MLAIIGCIFMQTYIHLSLEDLDADFWVLIYWVGGFFRVFSFFSWFSKSVMAACNLFSYSGQLIYSRECLLGLGSETKHRIVREFRRARSVGSKVDGSWEQHEGCHRYSAPNLELRLGNWIWGNSESREGLQKVYLLFWHSYTLGWQPCRLEYGLG